LTLRQLLPQFVNGLLSRGQLVIRAVKRVGGVAKPVHTGQVLDVLLQRVHSLLGALQVASQLLDVSHLLVVGHGCLVLELTLLLNEQLQIGLLLIV